MKRKPNWIVRRQLKMQTPEKAKARIESAKISAEWYKAMSNEMVRGYLERELYERPGTKK